MPILNYTTSIAVEKTVSEIQAMLSKAKATAILTEFDGSGNITALSFKINTSFGLMPFRLPIEVKAMLTIFNVEARAGRMPRRYMNDMDQARRVAWRILKDWLAAQLAIVETQMVKIEQVFLPYAQSATGETLYELMHSKGFNTLALEAPKHEPR